MQSFQGKSVYKGIVMGPIVVFKRNDYQVKHRKIENADTEIARVMQAIDLAKEQLQKLYDKAVVEVGEASAAIFEGQQMILEDEEYLEAVRNMIRTEPVNAENAVIMTWNKFSQRFAAMNDEYMKVRAADVKDVSERVIRNLSGQGDLNLSLSEPTIIVAEDLSPSEIMQMNKEKVLAIVTVHGSTNSHTAILARMMSIPVFVGVLLELENLENGMLAVADGFQGQVIIEPDNATCEAAKNIIQKEQEKAKLLQELKGKESVTPGGQKISIYANIGSVSDIRSALENDAEGIGLFRSEFMYMGRVDFPTEGEQYQAYKQAAQMMEDKKVIIRTLDIGADKQLEYFHVDNEDNSDFDYRGIRICLKRPDIFKPQLRALFRAAVYGNISIMYPMITSVEEVQQIRAMVEEVREELERQGVSYRIPEQGIMIETPAAVKVSDELAELVDFFSIGTNDLTRYTHPKAVLQMIQMVVGHAHKCGKRVGICGELAADVTLTEQLVRMGVDELSVAPSMVLELRKIVREMRK